MMQLDQNPLRHVVSRLCADAKLDAAEIAMINALADVCGLVSAEGAPIPLTQETLSHVLGLSSVHTNRVVQRLRSEGVLDFSAGVARWISPDVAAPVAPEASSFAATDRIVTEGRPGPLRAEQASNAPEELSA